MQLKSIMTHDVETIESDATIQQAAEKMSSLDVGLLPVCEGNKVLGVITDRDITVRATARGLDPTRTPVRDAMTELVVCGIEDQNINEGARMMMDNQIRRLPVLNHDKKLVGIISIADLLDDDAHTSLAIQILERVSKPAQVPEHT